MNTHPIAFPRHTLRLGQALLVPAELLLLLVVQALSAAPSWAARSQAGMHAVTIHVSSPQFPTTLTTGLVALTLVNDTKQEHVDPDVMEGMIGHVTAN